MQGKVLDFNAESGQGLIRGSDEKRYEFTTQDVSSQSVIKAGMDVDFEVNDNGGASSIYVVGGSGPSVMASVSSSEGVNKAIDYIKDSMKDGVKNKIALALCGFALISLFLPAVSLPFMSVSIMKHSMGIVLLLLLLGSAGLFFTGASQNITRGVVGVYFAISAWGVYRLFSEIAQGSRALNMDLVKLLDYGFYVWFFASSLLFLIAMIGDYDKRQ